MNIKERRLLDLLASNFIRDTWFSSRPEVENSYFRALVGWGKVHPALVITWLLENLDDNWHWSHALFEIVGKENSPHIPEEHAGKGEFIIQAWRKWAEANGYS